MCSGTRVPFRAVATALESVAVALVVAAVWASKLSSCKIQRPCSAGLGAAQVVTSAALLGLLVAACAAAAGKVHPVRVRLEYAVDATRGFPCPRSTSCRSCLPTWTRKAVRWITVLCVTLLFEHVGSLPVHRAAPPTFSLPPSAIDSTPALPDGCVLLFLAQILMGRKRSRDDRGVGLSLQDLSARRVPRTYSVYLQKFGVGGGLLYAQQVQRLRASFISNPDYVRPPPDSAKPVNPYSGGRFKNDADPRTWFIKQ